MKKIFFILLMGFSLSIFGQSNKLKTNQVKENCATISNKNKDKKPMTSTQKNVLGTPLELASTDPLTGYFRTGFCDTDQNDYGVHVVAAVVTQKFLDYSKSRGNDLMTPYPPHFAGLKAGDKWCLCALRWREALEANVAPPVVLEATNIKALEYVTLEDLKNKAVEK